SLASRMHLKNMSPVLKRAFKKTNLNQKNIDYISVTNGPGLIPALIIGVQTAKTLSYALKKPLVGIHHIEGHIYANWLKKPIKLKTHKGKNNFKPWKPEFPMLCLVVSGGHTQIILMKRDLNYKILGETVDDAVGEAFDKVAKLLGVGYPGGPLIEKMAKIGNKNKFNFTRPMMNSGDYNFSFSGLKTAVLYEVRSQQNFLHDKRGLRGVESVEVSLDNQYKSDIAASFQQAVIDVLIYKTVKSAKKHKVKNIILGGGVSANKELQKQLSQKIKKEFPLCNFHFPYSKLTTDNALMISIAAYYRIKNNKEIGNWKSAKADANLKLK
ncbi:MAG: tRNA (adenosine(37)-N6)-threonylcarbamoyltransferase complex transferase subunit TsaD, partial [Candidatus Pacebacteria bacterium]|nr:tRNA (adenosine(37)-N6)-threonylcarbamoyltransferase complex transferase subunit TsaD [Candidatus Paceibacterota bacterium]